MELSVLHGATATILIQLTFSLLAPIPVTGVNVPARADRDQHRYNDVWRRDILETSSLGRRRGEFETPEWRRRVPGRVAVYSSDEGLFSDRSGQHRLRESLRFNSIHREDSLAIRSSSAVLKATAHQAQVMSTKAESRNVQEANIPFQKLDGIYVQTQDEVAVLVAVKAAIAKDPLGVLHDWHPNASTACSWVGVLCSSQDEGRHVIALDLSGHELVGSIHSILVVLARLDYLQHVDLSRNGFHGSISGSALANMSSLQYLNFSSNEVTGSVPSEIGTLQNLQVLSLSINNLTGAIPSSIGNCSSLTALELKENLLTGHIPDVFGNTPKLQLFDVGNPLPLFVEFGGDFFSTGNSLTGSLPSSLGNCSSLLYLDVSCNTDLGGDLPPQISQLTKLQFLYMSVCSFTGVLDEWWGNMTGLRNLEMRHNLLVGKIPDSVGKLSNLLELALTRNSLSGQLPEAVTNCTSLKLLSLSYNNLTGDISRISFDKLSKTLAYVLLGENAFTGMIPPSLANSSSLQVLSLSVNSLDSQTLPDWVGSLSSLTALQMDEIQLYGSLPKEIGKLQNLLDFSVTDNSMSGVIPSALANCTSLEFIWLDQNQFTGAIPTEIGHLPEMILFDAHKNGLVGSIPLSFTNLTQLYMLDCSSNFLSGRIDGHDWKKISQLEMLNLSGNHLSGSVPSFAGNVSKLLSLDLSYNDFTGHIPAFFGNSSPVIIDLSVNRLSGKIPESLFKSSQLVIYLRDNGLEGTIPSEVGASTNLERLDLSQNRLYGELPESLGNCSSLWKLYLHDNRLTGTLSPHLFIELAHLRYLDLSSNLITGSWPQPLGSLLEIQTINISANNFSGSIRVSSSPSFAAWSLLESLDLSTNNFEGDIPASWGSVMTLKFFNASYNNFQGPIPTSGVFQRNLTNTSFLGNPGLCGAPLGPERECPSQVLPMATSKARCNGFVCQRVWIPTMAAGLSLLFAVAFTTLCWWKLKRGKHQRVENVTFEAGAFGRISEREIRDMMSPEFVLGRGANSVVYKGSRPGGKAFAIKTLELDNVGYEIKRISPSIHDQEQLLQEVHALAQLRHRNILKVLSFCSGPEVQAIILEYMPEGSLHGHLYASRRGLCQLLFHTRLGIAVGIADGMKYLHHDLPRPLIHGDLKPTNVLLDEDFTAKVADFGLSKFVRERKRGDPEGQNASASTIHIRGTTGYIPPEYAIEGRVSTRGDVYSFGVVLLEILTSKPPTEEFTDSNVAVHATQGNAGDKAGGKAEGAQAVARSTLVTSSHSASYRGEILKLYQENSLQMLDAEILEECTSDSTKQEQVKLLLLVALLCTRDRPQSRPTMSDVSIILAQISRMGTSPEVARKTIEDLVNEAPPQQDFHA